MRIEPIVPMITEDSETEPLCDIPAGNIYEESDACNVYPQEPPPPMQEREDEDPLAAQERIQVEQEPQDEPCTTQELVCARDIAVNTPFVEAVCLTEDDTQAKTRVKEDRGFMFFKKWWFRREVDFSVNGERITGTPIVLNGDTLRVVDEEYSYFIPIKNVDYIRTKDGYGR